MPHLASFHGIKNMHINPSYTLVEHTGLVNDVDRKEKMISTAKIFKEDGVDTTQIVYERQATKLQLIGSSQRGGAGQTRDKMKQQDAIYINIPHFQRDDTILAEESQDVKKFGAADELENTDDALKDRFGIHVLDMDITRELHRISALDGIVLDKDGNELINLHEKFKVDPNANLMVNLGLATAGIRKQIAKHVVKIKKQYAGAGVITSIDCFCGQEFWEDLIFHPDIEKLYLNWQAAEDMIKLKDPMGGFTVQGIRFIPYIDDILGTPAIPADEGKIVLNGTDMYETWFAPADYTETVNTQGLPLYAQVLKKHNNKGHDIEIQTNPIDIVTRPDCLWTLKKGT